MVTIGFEGGSATGSFRPVGRTRRDVQPAANKVIKLGYFESAQVNGLGQVIKWDPLTRTSTYDSLADSPRSARLCEDILHEGPPYRSGGNLLILKYENNYDHKVHSSGTYKNRVSNPSINGGIPYSNRRYVGGFSPPPNLFFQTGADFSSPGPLLVKNNPVIPTMGAMGDQAWSRTKPRLEQVSGFVAAAELDEFRPMIRDSGDTVSKLRNSLEDFRSAYLGFGGDTSSRTMRFRSSDAASAFLNYSFGWVPFLNDLISFGETIWSVGKLLEKLEKLNNVPFRRRVTLLDDLTSTKLAGATYSVSNGSYPMPCHAVAWPSEFFAAPPSYEVWEHKSTYAYGMGKWSFYRPELDASLPNYRTAWNAAKRLLLITGLRVSPSAIYNVIPWTWLIDWFTNLGSYFDTLTDLFQDQIVAHYVFAMQTQVITRTFTNVLPLYDQTVQLSFSREISSKQRVAGDSPYGFSLPWDGLSPKQLAILAALGITRSTAVPRV